MAYTAPKIFGFKLFKPAMTNGVFDNNEAEKLSTGDLRIERELMDNLGITHEVQRLTGLVRAFGGAGAGAGKFYDDRRKQLIGDGPKRTQIANSVFGRVRHVYYDSFNDCISKGYTLKESTDYAYKFAKEKFEMEMKQLDAEYPPDLEKVVAQRTIISERSTMLNP